MKLSKHVTLRVLPVFLALVLLAAGCAAQGQSEADYEMGTAAPQANALTPGGSGTMVRAFRSDDVEYVTEVYDDHAYEYETTDMAAAPSMGGGGSDASVINTAAQERKIVYTVDLSLETKDFEEGVAFVESLAQEFDGFVQSSYHQGIGINETPSARWSSYSVRVPAQRLEEFVARLEEQFNVTYSNHYVDDITDSYYDVQARIDTLEIVQAQLMAMLEEAQELEHIIEIQRELADVRYQLDSFISSRNRMDSSVSMSTVNLSLQEVLDYQPQTPISISFSRRISRAFQNSWRGFVQFCQNFLLGAIELLPFLILIVLAVFLLLLLRRRRRRRRVARVEQELAPARQGETGPTAPPEEDGSPGQDK